MTNKHPFQTELAALSSLIDITEADHNAGNFSFTLDHIQPLYFLVIASWIKTLKTTKSIHLLCSNGLSRDAEALLRVLVESLINLHYLSKEEQDKRTRCYVFLSITNKKMDGVISGTRRLKSIADKISPESRREVQRQYEKALQRRSAAGLTWLQTLISRLGVFRRMWPGAKTWSGHSTEVMAKKVDLHNFYDLVYRLSSETIHGTDLMRHLKLVDEEEFDMSKGVNPVFNPDHSVSQETLIGATLAFYLVLESVYDTLQHSRLAELKAHFETLKEKLPKPS